jgi:hypothetical protein
VSVRFIKFRLSSTYTCIPCPLAATPLAGVQANRGRGGGRRREGTSTTRCRHAALASCMPDGEASESHNLLTIAWWTFLPSFSLEKHRTHKMILDTFNPELPSRTGTVNTPDLTGLDYCTGSPYCICVFTLGRPVCLTLLLLQSTTTTDNLNHDGRGEEDANAIW